MIYNILFLYQNLILLQYEMFILTQSWHYSIYKQILLCFRNVHLPKKIEVYTSNLR